MIHMEQRNSRGIEFVLGSEEELRKIRNHPPLEPFAEEMMDFLGTLSGWLLKGRDASGQTPEAAAFAFWCRRAHLKQMRERYGAAGKPRLGRGVSLHFAPSNMPALFAFTMAAGALAGNSVIVRLPQKKTEQEEQIVSGIRRLLEEEYADLKGRFVFCRYPHDQAVTDRLCSLCDVRVIWGSDASVTEIRRSPLPPRAVDLPFASRGSAAAFLAETVCRTENLDGLAREFYNDTYRNDQNACSSPQMIFWLGTKTQAEMAAERFWQAVSELLKERQYPVPASVAVRKLDASLRLAAEFDGVQILHDENRLVRVQVPVLREAMWDDTVPGGFFIESCGEDLQDMSGILSGHCQTLCVCGLNPEETANRLAGWRVSGVDRVVPVGHALDFSLTWDGFDLIASMSREISSSLFAFANFTYYN